MALLAVSDREPSGDELIWTGATVPSTGESGGNWHLEGGDTVGTNIYVGVVALPGIGNLMSGGGGESWTGFPAESEIVII